MNIPKYILDIVKKARLTNGNISIKKSKLTVTNLPHRPSEDFIYFPNVNVDVLFLVDDHGNFLIDSDESNLIQI